MKKLFTAIFSFAMVMTMTVLASCGGAPSSADIEKIIDKYNDDEQLTPGDYNDLISYVDAAIDEVEPIMKKKEQARENDDYDRVDKYDDELEALEDKYEYYSDALRIIRHADDDDLGSAKSAAKKLIKKERRFEAKY